MNVFPDKLRRLPYRIRKRTGGSGWLVREGPKEKSVDRLYPTVGATLGSGTDPQSDYDDEKRGSLELCSGPGTLSLLQEGGMTKEGTARMNRAFIYGFLDEMDKGASVVERAADMLKDVKEHVAAGHKKRGLTGAAIGLEKGLRANPWLMLAPAGVYAGSKLLKGILNFGKREDER